MIIGFSGKAGSGKDTAAALIMEHYRPYHWRIKKFADGVRDIASVILGLPREQVFSEEFKQSVLPVMWALEGGTGADYYTLMTGRIFLQKLGTDAIRDGLHPDAWVNMLMNQYKSTRSKEHWNGHAITIGREDSYPNWLITDVRFPNEVKAIEAAGGIVIRLTRSSAQQMLHESEIALDNHSFKYTVPNEGLIVELKQNLINTIDTYVRSNES